MTDIQTEALRAMTPERRLQVAQQLRQTAWELKAAGIRMQNPELSEAEVQARVREIFLYART